jgi:hypothetical protein
MSKYVINKDHPPAIYDLHAVSVSDVFCFFPNMTSMSRVLEVQSGSSPYINELLLQREGVKIAVWLI